MDFFEKLTVIRHRVFAVFIGAMVALGTALVLLLTEILLWSLLPLFMGLALLGAAIWQASLYRRFYQNGIVKTLLQDSFDGVDHFAERGISREEIEDSGLVEPGCQYSSGNYISATYRGIGFRQSDASLSRLIKTSGKTIEQVLFSGRWMVFEFDTPLDFVLQIKEKSFAKVQMPLGQGSNAQEIFFEDEAFHRFFRVYTDNEKRARYILTEAFRATLLHLNYEIAGDLLFAFKDTKLHIAIHSPRKAFEVGLLRKPDHKALKKEMLADISVITSFIDDLLLENRLFALTRTGEASFGKEE